VQLAESAANGELEYGNIGVLDLNATLHYSRAREIWR